MDSIGVDIVEFKRIQEMMTEKFIKRVLSFNELELFNSFKSEKRRIEYLAGRFAAKEAYTKVYKKFNESLNFTDVEVLKDEFGAPYIVSKYHPEDEILVSISHSENYAVAMCIKK